MINYIIGSLLSALLLSSRLSFVIAVIVTSDIADFVVIIVLVLVLVETVGLSVFTLFPILLLNSPSFALCHPSCQAYLLYDLFPRFIAFGTSCLVNPTVKQQHRGCSLSSRFWELSFMGRGFESWSVKFFSCFWGGEGFAGLDCKKIAKMRSADKRK